MSETRQRGGGGAVAKILMPAVAAVASAVASYVAKKAPQYLEETVLPKLREAKGSAGGGVGDVAHDLADRARSVASSDESRSDDESRSNDELERRRRERADHRAARRKAS